MTRRRHPNDEPRESRGASWLLPVALLLGGAFYGVHLLLAPVASPPAGPGVGGGPASTSKAPEAPKPASTLSRLWRGLTGEPAEEEGEPVLEGDAGFTEDEPVPTTPLTIRVLGPEGPVPAAGATVFLDDDPLGVTDERGEVTVPYPVDGRRHDAWAEKGDAKAEAFFLREENLPAGLLTLVLRGAGTVRGLVLTAAGEPVSGAEVTLRPAATDPKSSGADGSFDFGALPEGGYEIVARTGEGAARIWANVTAATAQEVVLTLEPARRLAGIVIDEAGSPLPGLRIDGRGIVREALPQKTITDAHGRFDLLANDLMEVNLHVRGDGRLGEYEGPPRDDLRIVAYRGATAILVARRPSGEPVKQASFILQSIDEETGGGRWSVANPIDADAQPGRFRAEELAPGTWEVAEAGARSGERRKLATFTIAAGEEKEVEIELTAGTGQIRGRVVTDRGESVVGAQVRLGRAEWELSFRDAEVHTRSTLTDAEGAFSFAEVDDEDGTLKVTADGFAPAIVEVADSEQVVVTLVASRRLRGRVVDEKHLPLMEFFLDGRHIEASDGVFDEPIETSTVEAVIGGYGRGEVERTFAAGPGDVDLGEVMLSPVRPIRLRVLDPEGRPAVGAQVTVRGGPGRWGGFWDSPGTDREGRVQMVLPPGSYDLTASHPLHARSETLEGREINGGENLELRLKAGAWVFGSAGGPDRVVMAMPDGVRARSTADGSYRVGPISSRKVELVLSTPLPGGGSRERQTPAFRVAPGEEHRYDFDDPSLGTILLQCPPGLQGHAMAIASTGPHPRTRVAQSFGPGAARCPFGIEGLPAGPYTLQTLWMDDLDQRHTSSQEVLVEAGRTTEVSLGE